MKIKDLFYIIKYFFQKIFRPSHTSDYNLFNFDYYLATIIYPKLKLFIEERKDSGYPNEFIEYSENCGYSLEEYTTLKKEGKILGGEQKAWEEILTKILFAFEYMYCTSCSSFSKKYKQFSKKYGDVYDPTIENYKEWYYYTNEQGHTIFTASTKEKITEDQIIKKESYYYNEKLDEEFNNRVEEGLLLFGKYFRNLWM